MACVGRSSLAYFPFFQEWKIGLFFFPAPFRSTSGPFPPASPFPFCPPPFLPRCIPGVIPVRRRAPEAKATPRSVAFATDSAPPTGGGDLGGACDSDTQSRITPDCVFRSLDKLHHLLLHRRGAKAQRQFFLSKLAAIDINNLDGLRTTLTLSFGLKSEA